MNLFRHHISCPEDLTTTYSETRAGFISIALEKNKLATPYIEEAKILRNRIRGISQPMDLINIGNIRSGLIAASGISIKASKHLGEDGCNDAIKEFIKNFLLPAGEDFKDELIFRFLLTRGDSLGGSMRNLIGTLAKRKLNRTIIAALNLSSKNFFWYNNNSKQWLKYTSDHSLEADDAKGLYWMNDNNEHRSLYYDITVPLIGKNIDLILLNAPLTTECKKAKKNPENFIALGELKGGIDPAGADEHWKTGKTALDRIYAGFHKKNLSPDLLYVGAAIEQSMAKEIFSNLETGYIKNAANLTKDSHMTSITDWIISL